ncbi:MATE family efflux transporter [Pseudotenacibaculum sp. MALMAid0570]|uniref:MATE family efflux transporter n=1 Tax=Pseudotenacibaculum sp. MALMAid0570 TaxID=3143938 RepID=UPI0032DF9919
MKTDISFKKINNLAIPALIAGIAEPLISITDTAIIGNIDFHAKESLGAVAIVGSFLSMLIWVFAQFRSAVSSIISQYLGANKLEEVKTLPAQSFLIVVSIGLLIIATTFPFAEYIFKVYGAEHTILAYAIDYYEIRVFGLPFTLFVFAVFGTFRGLQNTFYPMIIAIMGAVLNVVFDLILVYGIEGWIPAMNIDGAAYASVISQVAMAITAAILLLKKTSIRLKIVLPFNKEIPRLIKMVFDLFLRTVALNAALIFAVYKATSYGTDALAAYGIGIQLWFFGAFFIDGYSSAGNILSGRLLGAKEYDTLVKLGNQLTKYGFYTGLSLAAFGFLFYNVIGEVFIKDQEVLDRFYEVFWIILIMQPLCSITFIFDGMFKGMGLTAFLRNLLLFATFIIFIPALLLFDWFDLNLYGIWYTFIFWIVARGLPLVIKFRRKFLPLVEKS